MDFQYALWLHMIFGAAALALFWRGLLAAKGSPPHRRAGRRFLVAMLLTVLTVPAVVLMRPVPFDPGRVVALVYLSVCVFTVVTLAGTAIWWKQEPDRFRGRHFKPLGLSLLVLGTVVLTAGLAKGDPVAAVLSWVGLAYGAAMVFFAWSRTPLHPRWWLSWHLSAVCGLFTAVHGTLLFVLWRWAVEPEGTPGQAAAAHAGVLLAGLALRGWFGRRRDIPWGFHAPAASINSNVGAAAPGHSVVGDAAPRSPVA